MLQKCWTIEVSITHDKPNPFVLSLSKGVVKQEGFDRACPEPVEGISPNGAVYFEKINNCGGTRMNAFDSIKQAFEVECATFLNSSAI